MAFIPYSNEKKPGKMGLTVDKQGRIYLNSALRRKLGITGKISLYLFFEKETRQIGISEKYKQGSLARVVPFNFDKKHYAQTQNFLDHHDIEYGEESVKYFYNGMKGDVMTFKPDRSEERPILSFKLERNGNLERIKNPS